MHESAHATIQYSRIHLHVLETNKNYEEEEEDKLYWSHSG